MRSFPIRTALTLVTLVLLLAAASRMVHGVSAPAIETLKSIVDFTPDRTPPWPLRRHPAPEAAATVHAFKPLTHYLLDADDSLDRFYAALWRTERGEPTAITRILHYGDSPTTADLITGDTRQLLQTRFGAAGHGFTLIGKPWAWYEHRGIDLSSTGWQMDPATRWDLRNSQFGLGGVAFSTRAAAFSRVTLRDSGESQVEVWFQRQPGGGSIEVSSGHQPLGSISTDAPARVAGFAQFDLPPGARMLEFNASGTVKLFGVTLENRKTGVVYDSVGMNGASVSTLAIIFNETHWAEELRHRDPDLIILNYGTNESSFAAFLTRDYEIQLREAIRRVRAALPDASILVMSPMDRGQQTGDRIATLATIPRIVEIQKRVATDLHCGFFNTFAVMGGEGTMARWYENQPRLVSADLIHPTPQGARLISTAFVKELVGGLERYKLRHILHPTTIAEAR